MKNYKQVQTFNFPKEIGFNYFGLGGDFFLSLKTNSFLKKIKEGKGKKIELIKKIKQKVDIFYLFLNMLYCLYNNYY